VSNRSLDAFFDDERLRMRSGRLAKGGAAFMNIGEPRRTIYIEPLEEPTSAPAEPLPPATIPEPSDPPTHSEPEPVR